MFGMLDYRAHNLYALLVYPFFFIFSLSIIVVPLLSVMAAIATTSNGIARFGLAFLYWWVFGTLAYGVLKAITWILEKIFYFFVDPIATDGRTKEEADFVVQGGAKSIHLIKMSAHPSKWTNNDIVYFSRLDWASRLFEENIQQRLNFIKSYYTQNPTFETDAYHSRKVLKDNGLSIGTLEMAITNPVYRGLIIQFTIFLGFYFTLALG